MFLAEGVGVDERGAAVVAADEASGLEGIENAADGGQRTAEAIGERAEIGVFVLADVTLDEVGALFVGHGARGARRERSEAVSERRGRAGGWRYFRREKRSR